MSRLLCLAVCAVMATFSSGCAGVISLGPGGASPGFIYNEVTYPNALNPGMRYQIDFDRSDIRLGKMVEAEAKSYNLLGIVGWGDSGYGDLMDAARREGADGVMNVTIDTRYNNVLGVYACVTTKLTGQQRPEKGADMKTDAKPAFAGTSEAHCSAAPTLRDVLAGMLKQPPDTEYNRGYTDALLHMWNALTKNQQN